MKVSAIQTEHLAEVGQFLHVNLNPRFSAAQWISSVTHSWAKVRPNFGMQLHDGDQLVGVFLAIYSDQLIDGKLEHFCNPHSWCVLNTHRQHGIGLVLNLVKQKGYHFTMFTPNKIVTEVFRGLKFKELDNRQYRCINLPALTTPQGKTFCESDLNQIAARLTGQDRLDFEAHRKIPWLNFVAFGSGNEACWVIYKPDRWKRMPAAWIMHVSNPDCYDLFNGVLRSHLFFKGFVTSKIEARWLKVSPSFAWHELRTQPKLFQSKSLGDQHVRDVYSELMSLDV